MKVRNVDASHTAVPWSC